MGRASRNIWIDRLAGLPMAMVFNLGARVLGPILRRDHSLDPQRTRVIVVAKFLGMGSIIQATPMLHWLRQRHPQARLVFVTAASNRALMERISDIDETLYIDDRSPATIALTTLRAAARMVRLKADHFIDLEVYAHYPAILGCLTLARNRLGFYRRSVLFKQGNYTHLVYFNTARPIGELYMQLGMVTAPPVEDVVPVLQPPTVHEADRAGLAERLGNLGRYVVLNPNASDLLLERRWPAAQFAELANRLVEAGLRVVLIGAPAEADYTRTVLARVDPSNRAGVTNSAGLLDIGQLLALLEGAACVVTNDTGPMHMSFALRRPTVALFGPCDPSHYGRQSSPLVRTHYVPVFCSPCVHHIHRPPCGGHNVCMMRIEVGDVLRSVLDLLAAPDPGIEGRALIPLRLIVEDTPGRLLGMVTR